MKPILCVITGPTACGKTDVSIKLAQHYHTHILSADSRQFYHQLKIGAATPTPNQLMMAPHHFIGHLSVDNYYNVYKFEHDALNLLDLLFRTHKIVILTGGSGLYIDALVNGIDVLPDPDPILRNNLNTLFKEFGLKALQEQLKLLDPVYYDVVDKLNPVRLIRAIEVCLLTGDLYSNLRNQDPIERPFDVVKIVLNRPKAELHKRIELRTEQMIKDGLVDEAKSLIPFKSCNALNTVGYKEIFRYLDNEISLEQAIIDIKTNTRRYAKRQITWFKRDESYIWMDVLDTENVLHGIENFLPSDF